MRDILLSTLAAVAVVFCVGQSSATEVSSSPDPSAVIEGEVITGNHIVIVDGDTIAVGHERIRILSIDTPETYRSRCENELVLGLQAKERLRQLLNGGEIRIKRDGLDRYHRTLASVFVDEIDVGETLIHEGYALRYESGGAAKLRRLQTWCGPDARLAY